MDAPKCNVCNHHHEQGTKCPVCGHTGKSRVFQLLRNPPLMNVFRVNGFDCFKRNPSIHNLDSGKWAFTKILRGRIFPTHAMDPSTESTSRHLLAFVGDAPIATARWRMVTETNENAVEIDLLGVLEDKRQKGYGKQLMEHILEDISTRLVELETPCRAVVAYIPDNDHAVACLKLFEVAGFQLDSQRHEQRGVSCFQVFMLAPT